LRLQYATRQPNELILDEKARLAGCIMIREEIKKIIEEFGIDYYMKAIRELIEDGRRAFIERVKERLVPGRYRGYNCFALTLKGLQYVHPLSNRDIFAHSPIEVLVREDGTIHVDFEGASKWGFHPYNCTPSAMDGGLWVATVQMLMYDGKINDGAYLCVTQNLPKGSIVNTDYPFAATSITWGFLIPSYAVYGMLLSIGFFARGFLEEVFLPSAANSLMNFGGMTQYGRIGAFSVFEMAGNQSGGRAVMDGIDCGYAIWNPEADQGNAELYELFGPIVWIGRRYLPNAHGYGMYRGGNGWYSMWLIKGTQLFNFSCAGHGGMTGYLKGLFGGYPGPGWFNIVLRNTNMNELIRAKKPVPSTVEDLLKMHKEGVLKGDLLISKRFSWLDVKDGDVITLFYTGGTGYGDPIERDPELVKKDIENGIVTPDVARKIYGVVLKFNEEKKVWEIDHSATEEERKKIREERLKRGKPVKEWWFEEKERVMKKDLPEPIKQAYKESMELSKKFTKEFQEFWQLPETFKF